MNTHYASQFFGGFCGLSSGTAPTELAKIRAWHRAISLFFFNDELRRAAARDAPMEVGLGRGGAGGSYQSGSWSKEKEKKEKLSACRGAREVRSGRCWLRTCCCCAALAAGMGSACGLCASPHEGL
jgi:hypothetical protein